MNPEATSCHSRIKVDERVGKKKLKLSKSAVFPVSEDQVGCIEKESFYVLNHYPIIDNVSKGKIVF